jgi:hypothetical protein
VALVGPRGNLPVNSARDFAAGLRAEHAAFGRFLDLLRSEQQALLRPDVDTLLALNTTTQITPHRPRHFAGMPHAEVAVEDCSITAPAVPPTTIISQVQQRRSMAAVDHVRADDRETDEADLVHRPGSGPPPSARRRAGTTGTPARGALGSMRRHRARSQFFIFVRNRATACVCNWQMRDSLTPRISPISFRFISFS